MKNHPNLSVPGLKKYMRNEGNKLAAAVFVAMAHAEVTRERVDAYIRPIFERYNFQVCERFRKAGIRDTIDSPKDIYLSEEHDKLAAFYAEIDAEHRRHGFTGPPNHCPALIAESALVDAEWTLIKSACAFLNVDYNLVYGERREKMLELFLGAAVQAVKQASAPIRKHEGDVYVCNDCGREFTDGKERDDHFMSPDCPKQTHVHPAF